CARAQPLRLLDDW
nr:immunoglobulin heavy chain junction region [Macaca mulatta]MOW86674.1 immunoglobulin heavy chain junction region [Macaca mulatta]MOW86676.1 immunoglobulin heavy chain junction region [Macaca mulatta]MOW86689.1 immunoglobulin heavy chain junction region [Macaca mulatta]MOW86747.1 immunoglobulin heavy chain junction region [Macaca mulatta]